ncbi:MAG: PIN domain-containing protein [Pedosphaera sp.]|nr:PIN domain-containing protein [Pedosphaera sp.]
MATTGVRHLFVDTNVLVYATDANSPWQGAATSALEGWRRAGTQLCLSVQVLREYLAVVTRPAPGQTTPPDWTAILANLAAFRAQFLVLEDTGPVAEELARLAQQFAVRGRQIHDANLVAVMRRSGVRDLLTHNTADFTRFSALIQVHPLVLATPS